MIGRRALLTAFATVATLPIVGAELLAEATRPHDDLTCFAGIDLGVPTLYGDGIHDDTAALQARIDACAKAGQPFILEVGTYAVTSLVLTELDGRSRLHGNVFRGDPRPGQATIFRGYRPDGDYAWITYNDIGPAGGRAPTRRHVPPFREVAADLERQHALRADASRRAELTARLAELRVRRGGQA